MADLDPRQREALEQLQTLTAGGDEQVAIDVLKSVDWDVQKAAELVFDQPSASTSRTPVASSSLPPSVERFEVDDSEQGVISRRLPASSSGSGTPFRPFPRRTTTLWSLFTYPLHILSSIFRFIFGILRIPVPQIRFTGLGLNFYRPLRPVPTDPRSAADRWIRALEDETGALCGRDAAAVSASGAEPGPSSVTSRAAPSAGEGAKTLPDFVVGSYEDVLTRAQKEARILCVVLVSEEHDDVPEFKRSTLTDPAFVKVLQENDILVWGGDVRDQDAWSAAQKLQVTTYPYVGFLALQPRRGVATSASSRSTTPPVLTVLSRHQGPSTPDTAPTSAHTLIEHLTTQLLPRVRPFLQRIHATARERARDRALRDEQDRAFADAARRDRERIEARMAEERRKRDEERRREEEAVAEAQRASLAEAEQRMRDAQRMEWRRWMRRAFVPDPSGKLRIAVSIPGHARRVQHFASDAPLTALYAFVDARFIPGNLSPESDPTSPPSGSGDVEAVAAAGGKGWWGFTLFLAYPRREVAWVPGVKLGDVEGLKGGGQVVVEMLERSSSGRATNGAATQDDGSDGYRTDED